MYSIHYDLLSDAKNNFINGFLGPKTSSGGLSPPFLTRLQICAGKALESFLNAILASS
jgi:hypothetical protein